MGLERVLGVGIRAVQYLTLHTVQILSKALISIFVRVADRVCKVGNYVVCSMYQCPYLPTPYCNKRARSASQAHEALPGAVMPAHPITAPAVGRGTRVPGLDRVRGWLDAGSMNGLEGALRRTLINSMYLHPDLPYLACNLAFGSYWKYSVVILRVLT